MKEAILYKKLAQSKVQCFVCSHQCKIPLSQTGLCGVRQNINGKLYSLAYGRAMALNIDPIEKKPFFHFLPGTKVYSLSTLGCNFVCKNCQNFDISQIYGKKGEVKDYSTIFWGEKMSPQKIIAEAKKARCESIAYTYNEPTVFVEYAFDIMKLAKKSNLKNVWVSNGFMSEKTFNLVAPFLDAINIDLKSFDNDFYQKNCGGRLLPVLENCQRAIKKKIHLEVTTLVIPTLSDNEKMLKKMAHFIKKKLGEETPWHLSAFSGAISWKLKNLPDTSFEKLKKIYKIAKKVGLKNVYLGNVLSGSFEDTFCSHCGKKIVVRFGYQVENLIKKGRCPFCKTKIRGVYA